MPVQGPFTPENMTNWYKAGYFWNKDLLICHEGWEDYVTIESIVLSVGPVRLRAGVGWAAHRARAPSPPFPAGSQVPV